MWQLPSVSDEAWWDVYEVPVAYGSDGTVMGRFELLLCAQCGFVDWYATGLGELAEDDAAGVHLDTTIACVECKHNGAWVVHPVRDLIAGTNPSVEAIPRGITHRQDGPPGIEVSVAPIGVPSPRRIDGGQDRTARLRTRKLLPRSTVRADGTYEVRVCSSCGQTSWFAKMNDAVLAKAKFVEHACVCCKDTHAAEFAAHDVYRTLGMTETAPRPPDPSRRDGSAKLLTKSCRACGHTDWFVADPGEIAGEAISGLRLVSSGRGAQGPERPTFPSLSTSSRPPSSGDRTPSGRSRTFVAPNAFLGIALPITFVAAIAVSRLALVAIPIIAFITFLLARAADRRRLTEDTAITSLRIEVPRLLPRPKPRTAAVVHSRREPIAAPDDGARERRTARG
jgi:hypothetical protein